jgi:hypothetical protein
MDVPFLKNNNFEAAQEKYLQNRGIFTDYLTQFDMTTIYIIWKKMSLKANIDLEIC